MFPFEWDMSGDVRLVAVHREKGCMRALKPDEYETFWFKAGIDIGPLPYQELLALNMANLRAINEFHTRQCIRRIVFLIDGGRVALADREFFAKGRNNVSVELHIQTPASSECAASMAAACALTC